MRSGPSALFPFFSWLVVLALPAGFLYGQARWDGEAGYRWKNPANWVGNELPGGRTSVLFDDSAGLAGIHPQMVFVSNSVAGDVTVDMPAWAVRPHQRMDALEIFGEGILFTDRFTGEEAFSTFSGASNDRSLRLRFGKDASILNNGSGVVVFSANREATEFGISGISGDPVDVRLGGSGDGGFVWEGGIVFKSVGRFGTAEDFASVLEIRGGRFQMSVDLRAEGGTIRILASNVIGDGVNLTLNSRKGPESAVIDISGAKDRVGRLHAFNLGGTLRVDGSTHYTFESYNGGPVHVEGFVVGETVLRFSESIDGKLLENILINGEPVAALTRKPRLD